MRSIVVGEKSSVLYSQTASSPLARCSRKTVRSIGDETRSVRISSTSRPATCQAGDSGTSVSITW